MEGMKNQPTHNRFLRFVKQFAPAPNPLARIQLQKIRLSHLLLQRQLRARPLKPYLQLDRQLYLQLLRLCD